VYQLTGVVQAGSGEVPNIDKIRVVLFLLDLRSEIINFNYKNLTKPTGKNPTLIRNLLVSVRNV
jgi:hypothetical protein